MLPLPGARFSRPGLRGAAFDQTRAHGRSSTARDVCARSNRRDGSGRLQKNHPACRRRISRCGPTSPSASRKRLRAGAQERVYERALEARAEAPRYVFHDGPPYANGAHPLRATCSTRSLKDIVVKYQTLAGRLTRFVPGWDCHGLPIELNVERALGEKQAQARARSRCAPRAARKREVGRRSSATSSSVWACSATWDAAVSDARPELRARDTEALAAFVRNGLVYRGKKPVHWCGHCHTALAEAEVEYHDHSSPSIYVKFPVRRRRRRRLLAAARARRCASARCRCTR